MKDNDEPKRIILIKGTPEYDLYKLAVAEAIQLAINVRIQRQVAKVENNLSAGRERPGIQETEIEKYAHRDCEIKISRMINPRTQRPQYFAETVVPYDKAGKRFSRNSFGAESLEEAKRSAEAGVDEELDRKEKNWGQGWWKNQG